MKRFYSPFYFNHIKYAWEHCNSYSSTNYLLAWRDGFRCYDPFSLIVSVVNWQNVISCNKMNNSTQSTQLLIETIHCSPISMTETAQKALICVVVSHANMGVARCRHKVKCTWMQEQLAVTLWGRTKQKYLHRRSPNWPAVVILRVPLQRGGSSGQTQPREGVVIRELRVWQTGHTVRLVVNVLPVRVQAWRSLGKRSEQVAVQLVHYLLVHAGFKLPGEEGGPHRLLQRDREGRWWGVRQQSREGWDKEERRRLGNSGVPG